MPDNLILLPILAQILLTLTVYIALGRAKGIASKNGQVDESRRGVIDDAWPINVQLINNNIRNQFETPILFFVLTLILWILGNVSPLAHFLAWLYVTSRCVHAWVHTGSNYMPLRRRAFQFSVLILFAMTAQVFFVLLRAA
jgi:hypothetical protein